MGRLILATPHYCLLIPDAEGVDGRHRPQPNPAAWKLFKIFIRCLTATASMAMLVWLFVGRHLNLDPDLQDPYKMTALVILSLGPVGFGFMMTRGDCDIETHKISAAQEE